MARESSAHRVARKDAPRVHLTYDVHTNGAIEKRDLPFVLGVVGDYRGHADPKKPLYERGFVQIDRGSFDKVMAAISPMIRIRVPNPAKPDEEIPIELTFSSMADFTPERIVEMVPHLKAILDQRRDLAETLAGLSAKDEDFLNQAIDQGLRRPEGERS